MFELSIGCLGFVDVFISLALAGARCMSEFYLSSYVVDEEIKTRINVFLAC
jgi:hypothetical protein